MKAWLKQLYTRLPIIRELGQARDAALKANLALASLFLRQELAHAPRYRDPRKLNHHELQGFSQNGEDGIVAEIFRRIGSRSRIFVEFGVGNGLENNSALLLLQGWRGCWIEGDGSSAAAIRSEFAAPLARGDLKLLHSFIKADNIEGLFQQLGVPAEFDLLSVDIDRNTYHVWEALKNYRPRVVVVEYNAAFPPPVDWVVPYAADRMWNHTCWFGASLKAYERLGASLGYALVGCDLSGTNAFFVRQSERLELFADPFTAETHYEPARYWTIRREAHARAFKD
jgi:hypothetical protein